MGINSSMPYWIEPPRNCGRTSTAGPPSSAMNAETPDLGEFELIQRFFTRRHAPRAAQSGVILGIGDDAAVLALPPETELVAAVDTIVAGRHFSGSTHFRSIRPPALVVNLNGNALLRAT